MNKQRKDSQPRERDEERVEPECKPQEQPERVEALDDESLDRVLHDCPL